MAFRKIKINESKVDEIIDGVIDRIFGNSESDTDGNEEDILEPMTYDYLFKRHEGLPDEYFVSTDVTFDPNETAMYTAPSDTDLNEGLIKTYPTEKAVHFVRSKLKEKGYATTPNDFRLSDPNDDGTIFGHVLFMVPLYYLNKEMNEILVDCFNTCGYYLAKRFNRTEGQVNRCIVFQFEPKYQTDLRNEEIGDLLYHVTTANAARKIMKQGFCPSNRSNNFDYSGRCYFFTVYDKNLFANYMKQSGKKNKTGKGTYNNDFEIITIDRKLLRNVDFFTDQNFMAKIAVFTYSNIPPEAIVKREKL